MDPDAALAQLREAMDALTAYRDGLFPRPDLDRAIEEATETFAGLDAWLKRGGFLPDEWNPTESEALLAAADNS